MEIGIPAVADFQAIAIAVLKGPKGLLPGIGEGQADFLRSKLNFYTFQQRIEQAFRQLPNRDLSGLRECILVAYNLHMGPEKGCRKPAYPEISKGGKSATQFIGTPGFSQIQAFQV